MKQRVYLLLLALSGILTGCNKDLQPAGQVFSAVVESPDLGDQFTKTILTETAGGCSVDWVENDLIRINACRYRAVNVSGGTASFVTDGKETPLPKYKACYPYSTAVWEGETMSVNLPSVQTEPAAGLVTGLPMYAESLNGSLQFKGLCGLVRFGFKLASGTAKLTSISLKSSGGGLSGNCSIVPDGSAWKAVALNPSAVLTLNCDRTVGCEDYSYCYVYVPPGKYDNLEIGITTDAGTLTKKSKVPITVQRSKATKINFSSLDPGAAGHEAVDLDLPSGLRWATMDIGAGNPAQSGTKTSWDDATASSWGGSWRLPTSSEFSELMSETYWKWVTSYKTTAVNGYVVFKAKFQADRGKMDGDTVGSYDVNTDVHIFLPANTKSGGNLVAGRYWSSEQKSDTEAYFMFFNGTSSTRNPKNDMQKSYFACVRPVVP